LNIHVILNGAERSEESRRLKQRDSSLRSDSSSTVGGYFSAIFGHKLLKLLNALPGKTQNVVANYMHFLPENSLTLI
jgi:hypothetical protein